MDNKIIIITAPSGAGKSTLICRLKKDFPEIRESISHTTREKRKGEREGEPYYFTSISIFKDMIERGEFLEWAKVHEDYYGTSKAFVYECINAGSPLLLEVDIQGVDTLKKHFGSRAVVIFVAPPSLKILKERLQTRATESQKAMNVRMTNAKKEILRKNDFEHCLVNDNLDKTYNKLKAIIEEILEK